jgi:hypothetical protein
MQVAAVQSIVLGGKLSIEFFLHGLESIVIIDYCLWFIMVSVGINGFYYRQINQYYL